MSYPKSVQKRLNKLKRTSKITREFVQDLIPLQKSSQAKREENGNWYYKNKQDLANLIIECEPLYERWSTIPQTAQSTGIAESMIRGWVRSHPERLHVRKAKGIHFICPDWIQTIPPSTYHSAQDTSKILDIQNLIRFKDLLKPLQPAGPQTSFVYDEKIILPYAPPKGYVSIFQIRDELSVALTDIRKVQKPDAKHPLKITDYYSPKSYAKIVSSNIENLTRLQEVLDFCNKYVYESEDITQKIYNLTQTKSIPTSRLGDCTTLFVSQDTEFQIRTIFRNSKKLKDMNSSLLPVKSGETYGPLTYDMLDVMLRRVPMCALSHSNVSELKLQHKEYNQKLFPTVPAIKYTQKSNPRFVASHIMDRLYHCIEIFEKRGGKVGSAGWPNRFVECFLYRH